VGRDLLEGEPSLLDEEGRVEVAEVVGRAEPAGGFGRRLEVALDEVLVVLVGELVRRR
jgi:hypothetical protein